MSQLATTVAPLLAEAREIYADVVQVEDAIRKDYDRLFCAAWRLGGILSRLKAAIGHGKWLFWLGANWEDLGEDKAQRCMQFFASNEKLSNPANLRDFNTDSIRKLMGGYLPAKIHPQLEGDAKLAPVVSFDSGVNKFAQYFRRIEQGHAVAPDWEIIAPQAKLVIEGLRKLYPGQIEELLG